MNWKCLLFGCKWKTYATFEQRRETLLAQACTRCDALRTASQ